MIKVFHLLNLNMLKTDIVQNHLDIYVFLPIHWLRIADYEGCDRPISTCTGNRSTEDKPNHTYDLSSYEATLRTSAPPCITPLPLFSSFIYIKLTFWHFLITLYFYVLTKWHLAISCKHLLVWARHGVSGPPWCWTYPALLFMMNCYTVYNMRWLRSR